MLRRANIGRFGKDKIREFKVMSRNLGSVKKAEIGAEEGGR